MSQGEGPSRPKGKMIDPREWGNLNLSQESLDIEAQAAALDSYKNQPRTTREYSKEGHDPRKGETQSHSRKRKRRGKPSKQSMKHPNVQLNLDQRPRLLRKAMWELPSEQWDVPGDQGTLQNHH